MCAIERNFYRNVCSMKTIRRAGKLRNSVKVIKSAQSMCNGELQKNTHTFLRIVNCELWHIVLYRQSANLYLFSLSSSSIPFSTCPHLFSLFVWLLSFYPCIHTKLFNRNESTSNSDPNRKQWLDNAMQGKIKV